MQLTVRSVGDSYHLITMTLDISSTNVLMLRRDNDRNGWKSYTYIPLFIIEMSRLLRRRLMPITSPFYRLLKQYITSKLTSNGISCTQCWLQTFCLVTGELNDFTPSKRWGSVDCVTTRAMVRSLNETVESQRRQNRARILSNPKIKQEWDLHTCQDDHLRSIPRRTRTTTRIYITETRSIEWNTKAPGLVHLM